jgi:tetratricopeptide (TPR) repeat protein
MRAMGHQWGHALVLINLALLARDQGEYQRAAALLEEALGLFRRLGDKGYVAYTLLILGTIASALGDCEGAGALYRECLTLRRDLQDKRGIATCLAALGCVAADTARFMRAATLFGAAEASREATGASIPAFLRDEYDRRVAATSGGLGEAAFKSAWVEGRTMPPDQAIDFAQESTSGDFPAPATGSPQ